jgi:hypothetical protein
MRGIEKWSGSNQRTTTQTDPLQANPLGRGQLADFCLAAAGLTPYVPHQFSRWRGGRRSVGVENWCGMLIVTASPAQTALKISQLTRRPPGGMLPTYDSMR